MSDAEERMRALGWQHVESWKHDGICYVRLICGIDGAPNCKNVQASGATATKALNNAWRTADEFERELLVRDPSKMNGPAFVKQLMAGYGAFGKSLYDKGGRVFVRLGWTPSDEQRVAAEQAGFHLLGEHETMPRDEVDWDHE